MRSFNLVKVALEAEIVRYKAMAARQGRRVAFGLVALVFLMGFLASLEVVGWQVARMYLEPIYASLAMLGINLVIAIGFAIPAMKSSPGRTEIDAVEVRKSAVKSLQMSLAISTALPVAGALWRRRRSTRAGQRGRKLLR
jgi:hypothetical protein